MTTQHQTPGPGEASLSSGSGLPEELRTASPDALIQGLIRLTHMVHSTASDDPEKAGSYREARRMIQVELLRRCRTPLPDVRGDIGPAPTHHPGTDTERVSADLIRPRAGTLRARALTALQAAEPYGLTDDELAEATEVYLYSIAPRRVELTKRGWVMDSGNRRTSSHGRPAVVWVLTGPAIEHLRQASLATVGGDD